MDEQVQSSGESPATFQPNFDLSVGSIISNGFSLGFKNLFLIIGCYILWAITLWIPYINVGTTIGLYGIVVKISKGERFGVGEIFKREYRSIMPEFLLLSILFGLTLYIAAVFVLVPAIILTIAWGFSYYFMIDKGLGVFESLKASNKSTYGHKWDIFGGMFILYLIGIVVTLILWLIFKTKPDEMSEFSPTVALGLAAPSALGIILIVIVWLIMTAVLLAAEAYIYRELSKKEV
ncbi:MAG: hypothetical protein ACPLRO_06230 [Candidatus Kapaibacteriota bacterium]